MVNSVENNIVVRVINSIDGKEAKFNLKRKENLFKALIRLGFSIPGDCSGMGLCKKCTVQFIEGAPDISSQDLKRFSSMELSQGYRLACMAYPNKDCTIILRSGQDNTYKVVTEYRSPQGLFPVDKYIQSEEGYALAIDLGTTTLAVNLVDLPKGTVLRTYSSINPQRIYGLDVISRIKASNEGKSNILMELVRERLMDGIRILSREQKIGLDSIKKIIISGNTTMIHLFMGWSCQGLGTYPFTPVSLASIKLFSDEIFGITEKIPIILLPGISAFVGGDITAGLLACGFDRMEKPSLFIDLGTNGEIALGNKDRILVSSTAAGPAFEGGNISCGVGSIPGAISQVSFVGGKLTYRTINHEPCVGLCGTGVIELTSELLNEGIIDASGLLADQYFDRGFPIEDMSFTQKDIRELQLAKAAIRTGIEMLINRFGISYKELDQVYIAGGFGYYLDVEKTSRIGLLPTNLMNRTKGVGNTSLAGAILAMVDSKAVDRMDYIVSIAKEIHLSNEEEFNKLYVKYMSF